MTKLKNNSDVRYAVDLDNTAIAELLQAESVPNLVRELVVHLFETSKGIHITGTDGSRYIVHITEITPPPFKISNAGRNFLTVLQNTCQNLNQVWMRVISLPEDAMIRYCNDASVQTSEDCRDFRDYLQFLHQKFDGECRIEELLKQY